MLPMDDLDELADARAPAKVPTDMASGVAAKKPVAKVVTDRERERRDAYEQDQRDQAMAAGQDQGQQGGPADAKDAQDKLVEAEYARRKADGGDDLDELARARQAASEEIDAQNAQAAMDQRSRAGLGGLGLSGAASAAESDLAGKQARGKALAIQEFDQAAEDQQFTEIQRQAALDDLEDAADIDYDGDGMVGRTKVGGKIGDGDPENDPFTGDLKDKPGAVIPKGGGKAKPIEDMTPEEFNKLSDKQAEAAGWYADDRPNDDGMWVWHGPDGQVMLVPQDDSAEHWSRGLEWGD